MAPDVCHSVLIAFPVAGWDSGIQSGHTALLEVSEDLPDRGFEQAPPVQRLSFVRKHRARLSNEQGRLVFAKGSIPAFGEFKPFWNVVGCLSKPAVAHLPLNASGCLLKSDWLGTFSGSFRTMEPFREHPPQRVV
jgi:hypothetical protein